MAQQRPEKTVSLNKRLKQVLISLTAAATVFGASAPAFAGGGGYSVGVYSGYGGGYYAAGYRGHRGYHRQHRRYHRGGGGKGAAIALGVIGGAILLSEAARAEERQRYEEERYYRDRYYRDRYYRDRYYDRYERRRYDDRDYEDRGYEDRSYLPEREYDDNGEGNTSDDALERELEGGAPLGADGPGPISISYRGAYDACTKHARRALSNRGFILAAPARPETAENVGGAYRITATVMAENNRGESWSRAMYCEADENRVYLLELI